MTMEAVADRFGVSRPTVSRMLQAARDRGIVRISLSAPRTRDRTWRGGCGRRSGSWCTWRARRGRPRSPSGWTRSRGRRRRCWRTGSGTG
ncbi:helix-turn-helix domain-containing protein [Kocuria flava]|uniref:helix-turn-helix domain-containing protein n=1 Tax=Kocuria flava TaxID=446860 RepID=UPI0027E36E63|nr:helix-turn-helix domain-containing protein [Kocuria flava]